MKLLAPSSDAIANMHFLFMTAAHLEAGPSASNIIWRTSQDIGSQAKQRLPVQRLSYKQRDEAAKSASSEVSTACAETICSVHSC